MVCERCVPVAEIAPLLAKSNESPPVTGRPGSEYCYDLVTDLDLVLARSRLCWLRTTLLGSIAIHFSCEVCGIFSHSLCMMKEGLAKVMRDWEQGPFWSPSNSLKSEAQICS